MKTKLYTLLILLLAIGLTALSCEGPAGADGYSCTFEVPVYGTQNSDSHRSEHLDEHAVKRHP